MSCFTILRLKQFTVLERSLIEQRLRQYLTCQFRFYAVGNENRHRHVGTKEHTSKRKALRTRILQDVRQTKRKMEEFIERENIWTMPNLLCMGRIVTTPFLSYLIISQDYQVAF